LATSRTASLDRAVSCGCYRMWYQLTGVCIFMLLILSTSRGDIDNVMSVDLPVVQLPPEIAMLTKLVTNLRRLHDD